MGFWGGSGGVLPDQVMFSSFLNEMDLRNSNKRPANPLEIYQATALDGVFAALRYVGSSTTNNNTWNAGWDTSIKCLGAVWITGNAGLMVTSDRRIKENIVDVSDNQALEMLRNILVVIMNTNKVSRGPDKQLFIANS